LKKKDTHDNTKENYFMGDSSPASVCIS